MCPSWMTPEQYLALPAELTLREVRVRVRQRGFRTKTLVVVTTLLDAEEFSAAEIGQLYRLRWRAELDLRSLKTVLQLDHLRCKTPHRVRNEFRMHLLAYNLIRQMMAVAALETGMAPWRISFKGALQTLNSYLPHLAATCLPLDEFWAALIKSLAAHPVGNRPDRYEPRIVKRRPKSYKFFRQPREEYRRRMR